MPPFVAGPIEPLLLSLLVIILVAMVVWGFLRTRSRRGNPLAGDDVLLGVVAFAAFSLGVFVTYLLAVLGGR